VGIESGLTPGRFDPRYHFAAQGFLDIGNGNRCPFFRKALGAGPANARGPTRDERYAPL
jgi:hypothetical protein